MLWKPKKDGEPFWTSPFGDGRPGWHIECSVMAKAYLGDTIDIHAGGEDLIFPHHENEIAQSVCANGVPFAKYWLHNAFLNIRNKKMSKSLGNFFTVRDITAKYDPAVLRLFMLSAHYRSPLNFSDELMESAKASLLRIRRAAERLSDIASKGGEIKGEEKDILSAVSGFVRGFDEKMDDDINTADAVSVVFDLVRFANTEVKDDASGALAGGVLDTLCELTDILGIDLALRKDDLAEEVEEKIRLRQEARKNKDFTLADRIRDELLAAGIELMDTKEGVKWKKV